MGLYAGRLAYCSQLNQRTAMTNKEFRPKLIAHLIAMADANDNDADLQHFIDGYVKAGLPK